MSRRAMQIDSFVGGVWIMWLEREFQKTNKVPMVQYTCEALTNNAIHSEKVVVNYDCSVEH